MLKERENERTFILKKQGPKVATRGVEGRGREGHFIYRITPLRFKF